MRTVCNRWTAIVTAAVIALGLATSLCAAEPPATSGAGVSFSTGNAATMSPEAGMLLALKKVTPVYPPMARRAHVTGRQEVQVSVGTKGEVTDTKVLSGSMMFASASVAAAKQWKFAPLAKNGVVTAYETTLVFQYGGD